jgi:hypothetical protein
MRPKRASESRFPDNDSHLSSRQPYATLSGCESYNGHTDLHFIPTGNLLSLRLEIGPDIFDKTPEDGGAWRSALQAALVKESVADGRVYLRLVHWPPGLLAPVESGAPEFTSDNWHTVRISIDQDRGVSLYQDGALVARGKLTDDSRSGVVGGHPGLYAYNWHQFSPPLAGTLLVDGYQITCW